VGRGACAKPLAGKTTITTATWLPSQGLHSAIALITDTGHRIPAIKPGYNGRLASVGV